MNLTKSGIENYEGWYALAICILKPATWEDSFLLLSGKQEKYAKWDNEKFREIIRMHDEDGLQWKTIAKMMDVSASSLHHRVSRWKEKNK